MSGITFFFNGEFLFFLVLLVSLNKQMKKLDHRRGYLALFPCV